MKKKVIYFSLFILVFSFSFSFSFFRVKAQYVEGGVNITQDCGYYTVTQENFNDTDCRLENGKYVYKVVDSTWYGGNNPIITVDISEFGLSSQALYRGAYKTIIIIFQITLREEDDGYQEIYLVDDIY